MMPLGIEPVEAEARARELRAAIKACGRIAMTRKCCRSLSH